jgi:hypothetical protein
VIASGSTIRYVGQWQVTAGTYLGSFNPNPDGILSDVSNLLSNQGIHVRDSSIQTPNVAEQVLSFGFYTFGVTLNVQIDGAFDKAADVEAIINNAVYQITGTLPVSSSVPTVTFPGKRAQKTGEPEPKPPENPSLFDSIGAAFKDFFAGFGTVGTIILILLAAVVLTVFAFGIKAGI